MTPGLASLFLGYVAVVFPMGHVEPMPIEVYASLPDSAVAGTTVRALNRVELIRLRAAAVRGRS